MRYGIVIALAACAMIGGAGASERFASTRDFEAEVQKIEQQRQRRLAQARQQYVAQLKVEMDAATRLADLDRAVKIQREIEAMQKHGTREGSPVDRRNWLSEKLADTIWTYNDQHIRFHADGTGLNILLDKANTTVGFTWLAMDEQSIILRWNKPHYHSLLVFDKDLSKLEWYSLGPTRRTEPNFIEERVR